MYHTYKYVNRSEHHPLLHPLNAHYFSLTQADEDRWALYYGTKVLMKELPEAKLWYNLLDERYGEDENMFYLFCMRVGRLSLSAFAMACMIYTVIIRRGANSIQP